MRRLRSAFRSGELHLDPLEHFAGIAQRIDTVDSFVGEPIGLIGERIVFVIRDDVVGFWWRWGSRLVFGQSERLSIAPARRQFWFEIIAHASPSGGFGF